MFRVTRQGFYIIIDTIAMVVFVFCQKLYSGIIVWVNIRYRFLLTFQFVLPRSRGYFLMLIVGLILVSQTPSLQMLCEVEPAAQDTSVQMALQGYPPSAYQLSLLVVVKAFLRSWARLLTGVGDDRHLGCPRQWIL